MIAQLTLLKEFSETAPTTIEVSSESDMALLTTILGPIIGALAPLGFGEWFSQSLIRLGNRRTKVRSLFSSQLDHVTKAVSTSEQRKTLSKALDQSAKETKKGLTLIKKGNPSLDSVQRLHQLNLQQLEKVTQTPQARFHDLNSLIGVQKSIVVDRMQLAAARNKHADFVSRMERDEAWSRQHLKDVVTSKI